MTQEATVVNAPPTPIRALQERREVLADQYQTVMTQRGHIGQERLNAQARGDVAMVKEYEGVVSRLGERLQGIEREMQVVDKQLEAAMKSPVTFDAEAPVAGAEAVTFSTQPPYPIAELILQRAQFQRFMVGEAVVMLMLGAVLWRFGVARGRRQAARVEAPRDDSKLQQAVEAIAIEVERLSEGQRFVTKILSTKRPERDELPVAPPSIAAPPERSWITPH